MVESESSHRSGRVAVVVVHGMGEQRPLDMLTGFIKAGLPPESGKWHYFSRPDIVTESFESRRFLAPPTDKRPQVEYFEYHWAHLMQGNRFADLWPTVRRLMLRRPKDVPNGLRGLWLIFWVLIAASILLAFTLAPTLAPEKWNKPGEIIVTVLGAGSLSTLITFLLTKIGKVIPGILTNTFVDVVRYLDTSPRSYEVRHDIRKGMVDLLNGLHTSLYGGRLRYDRIVIVAHSLGSYIAYDAISYPWATMNYRSHPDADECPVGLKDLEDAAAALLKAGGDPAMDLRRAYQDAQHELWWGPSCAR